MTNSNAKGDRNERELVNLLDSGGYEVMRAPASGSATERELPDVLAGDGTTFYVIEAKSSAGNPIYLDAEEVEALKKFADGFGGLAQIAVKFDVEHGDPDYGEDTSGWYLLHPSTCWVTDGGNYRVKKELAHGTGRHLESLFDEPV